MKIIRLGTIHDMDERLIEFGRKALHWAEQWLGVHYLIGCFFAGFIAYFMTYPDGPPPDLFVYIAIPIYIISAWHWITTRKARLWMDEHGVWRFTYNQIHGKRAVLNPIKRYKDIISNAHNGKIVITLIEAHKVRVDVAGKKDIMTPETLGLIDKRTKEPNISWVYFRQSCEGNGIIDFNTQNAHYLKDRNKIAQQVSRFRKALAKGLDIEIERGRDYHFDSGVFTWKSLTFRDEYTPFDIQRQREEVANEIRSRMQLHSLQEITKRGGLSNPEVTDEENDYEISDKPTWKR